MTEPTADEIARWAALADAATPGPWHWHVTQDRRWAEVMPPADDRDGPIAQCIADDDAEFIAAARTAVPRLLALVAAQADQIAVAERERRAAGVRFEKSLTEQDAKLQQALKVLREARTEVDRLTHAVSEKYYRGAEMIDAAHERARTAEAKIARVRALFVGGPDTPCKTVWQDGIECVSVPLDDIRAALDGTEATP